jgi:hypothetical protein
MTTGYQALPGQFEMAVWWRCNVHHVRGCFLQQVIHIIKAARYLETLSQLIGHQLLTVTYADKAGPRDAPDLLGMLIGNLTAADNGTTYFAQEIVSL